MGVDAIAKFFLIITTFLSLSATPALCQSKNQQTFSIDIVTARPKLFARVMQVLGTTCHQLVENVPCRRFEVFDSEAEVKGRFPAKDGVFLIRVREKERSAGGQAQFAIAMLHRPHGKLIAFANPGEFRFPSDYQLTQGDRDNSEVRVAQDLAKTLLNLAFK